MPRLPPALIRQAAAQHPLLPLLLRVCRDIYSAQNELRWLQEHARDTVLTKRRKHDRPPARSRRVLRSLPQRHACKGLLVPTSGRTHSDRFCKDGEEQSWEEKPGSLDEEHPLILDITSRRLSSGVPPWDPVRECEVRGGHSKPIPGQPTESALRDTLLGRHTEVAHTRRLLAGYVTRRARGVPLQYLLGSQPFGNLEILTRKAVLIPRPETETYTEHVARLLLSWLHRATPSSQTSVGGRKKLRILDLCSGTGCIALLLHSLLKAPQSKVASNENMDLEILGSDISSDAIHLAERNLQHNIANGLLRTDAAQDISFRQMDILQSARLNATEMRALFEKGGSGHDDASGLHTPWDVIISNPPYISPRDYGPGGKTESSVRKYEPRIALVPPVSGSSLDGNPATDPGDVFYGPLMDLIHGLGARLLLMEVGDSQQAGRVHEMARRKFGATTSNADRAVLFEAWQNDGTERLLPAHLPADQGQGLAIAGDAARQAAEVTASVDTGTGTGVSDRAVVIWTGDLAQWRRSARWAA
ncbi:hypothetical protein A1O3_01246 [Capronia epimyces CBS 606.96]|uniref:Methyltransferase domain-containing protein n=1 Tax=Capronia epimyces CBS 606.96 TaxID=1182542 RepID=W9ZDU2_9EURO|nr:uncharacterized protein A1O3_01246 [Capronia epimyces CBS 606.96]EXJ92694.1 hypothetical protein A1O3_01246 [Capronia epimyces CBS 606.96]